MPEKKLEIQNVSKVFTTPGGRDVPALQDVDAYVEEGEFVTIVGTSGCGKSTLLRIVAGLDRPTSGRIVLDGRETHRPGADRGMVFQSYTLYEWLTVAENIGFGLRLAGESGSVIREKTQRLIHEIGLTGFEDAYPKFLSGGMKQRVAIARAMANDPAILLLDEPFGALDAQTRSYMQEMLLKLVEENKMTVLFVTHDIDEAIFLGDAVYVMTFRPGRIKEEFKIDAPHPRSYEMRTNEFFIDLKKKISGSIRDETLKAVQAGTDKVQRRKKRGLLSFLGAGS
jgi:ABC-type nitrate/sulfonate/bicarbonate transport system ATPase subunit